MARLEGISDVSNLAMWMTWVSVGGGCVIYGSQTGGGKMSCGWLPDWEVEGRKRGKKICWWLPDWEV